MPNITRKNLGNKKVKTFRKTIIKPPSNKKGVKYLIEPLPTVTTQSPIKGDIIKKYVNGKLVKQVFASEKKIKHVVKKIQDKHRRLRGGSQKTEVANAPAQKVEIETSDKTTFSQSLKSGFGSGLGFGAAFEFIKWIFGSDGDSDE